MYAGGTIRLRRLISVDRIARPLGGGSRRGRILPRLDLVSPTSTETVAHDPDSPRRACPGGLAGYVPDKGRSAKKS